MRRSALITGGGGAIAMAIALRLVERGYDLLLADFDEVRLKANVCRLPDNTEGIIVDLSSIDGIEMLARRIEDRQPAIDLLVNCAGYVRPGHIDSIAPDVLYRHVSVNLLAPMRLIQAAGTIMAARGGGEILTLVSAAALIALPGSAAYSASKFGLRGFLISAHLELAAKGVVLSGVFPGAVDTPMLRYEAVNGGSALNFMNKDVLSADQVADAALCALESRRLETFLPWGDRILGKILVNKPGLLARLLPGFEKKGEKGRARFIADRNL